MTIRAAFAAILFSAFLAAPAMAQADNPDQSCSFAPPIVEATLKDFPPLIRSLLPSPIADRGEPFNLSDVVDPQRPMAGLIRGGHMGARWFAWVMQGGRASQKLLFVFNVTPDGKVGVFRLSPVLAVDICTGTKNFLSSMP